MVISQQQNLKNRWSSKRNWRIQQLQTKLEKNHENEIKRCITIGWKIFCKNRDMADTFPICLKCKVYNQCIIPDITYGCERWKLSKSLEKKHSHTEINGRALLRINLRDKRRSTWISWEQIKMRNIREMIKQQK